MLHHRLDLYQRQASDLLGGGQVGERARRGLLDLDLVTERGNISQRVACKRFSSGDAGEYLRAVASWVECFNPIIFVAANSDFHFDNPIS